MGCISPPRLVHPGPSVLMAHLSFPPTGMKRPLSPSHSPESGLRLVEVTSCPPGPPEQRMKREKKHQSFTLCEVCNIQLNSAAQAQIHCNGKSHQKRLKQLNKGKMPAAQGRSWAGAARGLLGAGCSAGAAWGRCVVSLVPLSLSCGEFLTSLSLLVLVGFVWLCWMDGCTDVCCPLHRLPVGQEHLGSVGWRFVISVQSSLCTQEGAVQCLSPGPAVAQGCSRCCATRPGAPRVCDGSLQGLIAICWHSPDLLYPQLIAAGFFSCMKAAKCANKCHPAIRIEYV